MNRRSTIPKAAGRSPSWTGVVAGLAAVVALAGGLGGCGPVLDVQLSVARADQPLSQVVENTQPESAEAGLHVESGTGETGVVVPHQWSRAIPREGRGGWAGYVKVEKRAGETIPVRLEMKGGGLLVGELVIDTVSCCGMEVRRGRLTVVGEDGGRSEVTISGLLSAGRQSVVSIGPTRAGGLWTWVMLESQRATKLGLIPHTRVPK